MFAVPSLLLLLSPLPEEPLGHPQGEALHSMGARQHAVGC